MEATYRRWHINWAGVRRQFHKGADALATEGVMSSLRLRSAAAAPDSPGPDVLVLWWCSATFHELGLRPPTWRNGPSCKILLARCPPLPLDHA